MATVDTLDVFGDGSCVECWPFDGSTEGLGGTVPDKSSGTPSYVSGKYDDALRLSNSGDYLSYPVVPDTTVFAVSFFFDADADGEGDAVTIYDAYTSTALLIVHMENGSEGSIISVREKSGGTLSYLLESDISTLTRRHIVVQRDDSDAITLYVDGDEIGSTTAAAAWSGGGHTVVGEGIYSGYPGGEYDQIRVFNRVLSESEIYYLMRNEEYTIGGITLRHTVDAYSGSMYDPWDTLDVFGDGSCVECLPFDGSLEGLAGGVPVVGGQPEYSVAKVGTYSIWFPSDSDSLLYQLSLGGAWSIGFWVRTPIADMYDGLLLSLRDGNNEPLRIEISDDGLGGGPLKLSAVYDGAGEQVCSAAITANEWVYISVNYDGGDIELFLDGEPAGTGTVTAQSVISELYINGSRAPARYDHIRVFNRVLSGNESEWLAGSENRPASRMRLWHGVEAYHADPFELRQGVEAYHVDPFELRQGVESYHVDPFELRHALVDRRAHLFTLRHSVQHRLAVLQFRLLHKVETPVESKIIKRI